MKTSTKWILGIGAGVGAIALLSRHSPDGVGASQNYDRLRRAVLDGDILAREDLLREAQRRNDLKGFLAYWASAPQATRWMWDKVKSLVERAADQGIDVSEEKRKVLEWPARIRSLYRIGGSELGPHSDPIPPSDAPWRDLIGSLGVHHQRRLSLLDLGELPSLENLFVNNTQLNTLRGIENFPLLKSLYANNTGVSDLQPLSGLQNLETLEVRDTQVSSLKPLRELDRLTRLNARKTLITSLEGLEEKPRLQYLDVSANALSDISELESAQGLQYANFSSTSISDLSPLRDKVRLRVLDIQFTNVSDLTPIHGLPQLREVYRSGAPLTVAQINALRSSLPEGHIY